jgi:molybdenum cofactor biosynthesis enzyme MoaA
MILTEKCNFSCTYCRGLRSDCRGEMPFEFAKKTLGIWIKGGLKNVRFSGGEPTLYPYLNELVKICKINGVEHIAISSNGSADTKVYDNLIKDGVNDFSISLDACCSSFADKMAGVDGYFNTIVNNIKNIAKQTYITVGVVLSEDNVSEAKNIIGFAHELGVSDIRIISAAQYNKLLDNVKDISEDILNAHPILKYRINNIRNGINVRGLKETDCHKCYLMMDDDVVAGKYSFPCVIYMREGGNPVCEVSDDMRQKRIEWMNKHDTYKDPICRFNCLDVCLAHNLKCNFYENL